jgi:serine protease Do
MDRLLIWALVALIAGPLVNTQAFARGVDPDDSDVAQQTIPAIVNLSVWKMRPPANAGHAPQRVKTYGSGFIIDPTGIIVTNKHVIDGAIDVMATFSDGNQAHAKLLAAAAISDLAVLKVDADRELPVLKWGNSDALRIGETVLTIGNPQGIGMSVSAGVVSALNRNLEDTPFDRYIQTDAAVNHGNSGGPLVNRDGEVVGVATALYNTDPKGGFIGIGFAIPANGARFVVSRLLDPDHPKAGWLGVKLQDVTAELTEALKLPGTRGAIIAAVDPGGPAYHSGLMPGDVLMRIGDEMPNDSRAFMRAVVLIPVGQPARLTIWRAGKEQKVVATVAEWPNRMPGGGTVTTSVAKAMIQKPPDLGLSLAPLTAAARSRYGLDPKLSGILVIAVEKDCEAGTLGVLPGDVITMVQDVPVTSPADVSRALVTAYEQHHEFIAMLLRGKGGTRWVSLSMGGARP